MILILILILDHRFFDRLFIFTQTNMSLTKSIVTLFDKQANVKLNPIEELDNYDEEVFEIDGFYISGYATNDDNTNVLYVIPLGGKKPKATSYYKTHLERSALFDSEEFIYAYNKVYFVVFKNKDTFYVYCLDNTKVDNNGVEIMRDFPLTNFSSLFGSNGGNGVYQPFKKEIDDIIQTIWSSLGCGSDQRTPFIIITWILLTHDEIPFKKTLSSSYSLREWIEINHRHTDKADKISNTTKKTQKWIDEENMLNDTKPEDVLNAFESVLAYKLTRHNASSVTMKEVISKQLEKLRKTIQTLYTAKTQKNALMVASMIHDMLYVKYGSEIDINKLAFEVENRWNNRTAGTIVAQKGQIYTHRMMKELILKILGSNIRSNSTCYDPTCGTGGFTETFYKYCKSKNINDNGIITYGNEKDEDCANMAWLSGLCSDYDVRVFQSDCFDPEIKELIPKGTIDFLLMNPPYGMTSKGKFLGFPDGFEWKEDPLYGKRTIEPTEWTFCRYNLDSFVKRGGWFGFVVPIQIVSENKKYAYDKQCLIESCEIWFVIRMRDGIFQPYAGAVPCLVIGKYVGKRTKTEIETWKTKLIDFRDDSGTIGDGRKQPVAYKNQAKLERLIMEKILDNKCLDGIHGERLESLLYETNIEGSNYYDERILTADENWIYLNVEETPFNEFSLGYKLGITQIKNEIDIKETMKQHLEDEHIDWANMKNVLFKKVKVSDIFDILPNPPSCLKYNVSDISENMTEDKQIPFYSMIDHNNGLKGFIEKAAVTDEGYYIIIGNYSSKTNEKEKNEIKNSITTNSSYCSYLIEAPFNYDSVDAIIIKPKDNLNYLNYEELVFIAYSLGLEFSKKYNYCNKLNTTRLLNETVTLPFDKKTNIISPKLILSYFECDYENTYKNIRVGDIFDLISFKGYSRKQLKPGPYPFLLSGSKTREYVDKYVGEGPIIGVPTTGSCGVCRYITGKFCTVDAIGHSPTFLKLKPEYEYLTPVLYDLSFIMTDKFIKRYNYSTLLNNYRLENETIPNVPVTMDENGQEIINIHALHANMYRPCPTKLLLEKFNETE